MSTSDLQAPATGPNRHAIRCGSLFPVAGCEFRKERSPAARVWWVGAVHDCGPSLIRAAHAAQPSTRAKRWRLEPAGAVRKGDFSGLKGGNTGIEPVTNRVTVDCSTSELISKSRAYIRPAYATAQQGAPHWPDSPETSRADTDEAPFARANGNALTLAIGIPICSFALVRLFVLFVHSFPRAANRRSSSRISVSRITLVTK